MPCDDGNPCTIGESCLAGRCNSGPSDPLVVSTPIEFDPELLTSGVVTGEPVGVIATATTRAGGFEVVWLRQMSSDSARLDVFRSRVDIDGAVTQSDFLGRAQQARAAYFGDDLYLLLLGCSSCQACTFALQLISSFGTVVATTCLDASTAHPDELALVVNAEGVYVAQIEVEDGSVEQSICLACDSESLPAATVSECAAIMR
jgi:threonine dehydrogenase-like Zn-dependent dehydrogenase